MLLHAYSINNKPNNPPVYSPDNHHYQDAI